MQTKLSFVIPCYRSEDTIEKVIAEIINVVAERPTYDYEIICVNDVSPDGVFEVLKRLATQNYRIKVIDFAKNMGKHAAVLAGYSFVTGDIVVNLDDDCQCPVNQLWQLIDPLEQDECDVVTANYPRKKEAMWKRWGSAFNSWVSSVLLDKPKELRFENFGAMKSFVAKEMAKYPNPYAYLEGLTLRVTRRIKSVSMEERERGDNKGSGFTFGKSLSLFFNGLTAFSVKPLRMSAIVGIVSALIGFTWAIVLACQKISGKINVAGYASITVILLIIGGLILMSLGLMGEYIGRIYISINKAPQYVIRDTINCEEK